MNLDIMPEHLPVISAQICATQASLTSVVGAAAGAAAPVPAAIDPVSQFASEVFAVYGGSYFDLTANGLAQLLGGAEMLVPVSATFEASDVTGGTRVGCQGAAFPR